MTKPIINYSVNLVMSIAFLICSVTGLVIFFFLPGGIQRGGYQEFIGITKHVWSTFHEWAGIVMIIFVLMHLISHRKWMKAMTLKFLKKK